MTFKLPAKTDSSTARATYEGKAKRLAIIIPRINGGCQAIKSISVPQYFENNIQSP